MLSEHVLYLIPENLNEFCPNILAEKMTEEDTGGGKATYAERARSHQILSIDFELKEESNVAFSSVVGKILMDKLGIEAHEIAGVHRSGIMGKQGFMKIRMKQKIDVSKRFAKAGGKAENESGKVSIRGVKIEDGSVIIRIISPNKAIPLEKIRRKLGNICELKSDIYEEKFASGVVLFGGLANENFRMRGVLKDPKKEDAKEIMVEGKRIKIAVLGKRRCYDCNGLDHMRAACPNKIQEKGIGQATLITQKDSEPQKSFVIQNSQNTKDIEESTTVPGNQLANQNCTLRRKNLLKKISPIIHHRSGLSIQKGDTAHHQMHRSRKFTPEL